MSVSVQGHRKFNTEFACVAPLAAPNPCHTMAEPTEPSELLLAQSSQAVQTEKVQVEKVLGAPAGWLKQFMAGGSVTTLQGRSAEVPKPMASSLNAFLSRMEYRTEPDCCLFCRRKFDGVTCVLRRAGGKQCKSCSNVGQRTQPAHFKNLASRSALVKIFDNDYNKQVLF